jgi:hypothetical protein
MDQHQPGIQRHASAPNRPGVTGNLRLNQDDRETQDGR